MVLRLVIDQLTDLDRPIERKMDEQRDKQTH